MRLRAFGLLALGLTAVLPPAMAHHSMAAMYDDKKPVTLKGTVSGYEWTNPHVFITVEASDGSWAVELPSRVELRRVGWTRESVKAGDAITVEGNVARDGTKRAAAKSVTLANGKKLVRDHVGYSSRGQDCVQARAALARRSCASRVSSPVKKDIGPTPVPPAWWRPPQR